MAILRTLLILVAGVMFGAPKDFLVFVGTYTREKSKGIYAYRFDAASGRATELGLAGEMTNPSFLALHPNGRFLYAVGEVSTFAGEKGGAVSAFALDKQTGKLTPLNTVSSRGPGPAHLAVDRTGKALVVANYGGGSTASFPIQADGKLGPAASFIQHTGSSVDPKRQRGPHAHSATMSPDNRFVLVADLGLDQVLVYKLDPAKATLAPNDPPFAKVNPGAGPRHFAFHPNGRLAYVINELQSTVTAFTWAAKQGVLSQIQTISTLPKDFSGTSYDADVHVHPNGKFLYGSNRGHDSIAVFAIDSKGMLTPIEYVSTQGKIPRNFAIDPTGAWLWAANQNTDNIVIFRIDQKTGRLTPAGQTLEVGAPVCVQFLAVK